jgi:hypothetical protein
VLSFGVRSTGGFGDNEGMRLVVLSLRGRPTGRFGDTEPALSIEASLRGRPRPLTGGVFRALSSEGFFLGLPGPRVGDVCAGLSSEESLRGRPRPRLGERITAGLESRCIIADCTRALFLSGDAVVVEKERACNFGSDVLVKSGATIGTLASRGCSAVLLAGDGANSRGRSCGFVLVACGTNTESSLLRNIQSSPSGGASESAASGGARWALSGEV